MTRRRIIAGVILLAAVAVAVPGVWRVVVYQEVLIPTNPTLRDLFGNRDYSAEPHSVVLVKRLSWLPGAETVLPDQQCHSCLRGNHKGCWGGPGSRPDTVSDIFDGVVDWRAYYRCTCTDPWHKDKP